MRVVVAGGSGFIGEALCAELVEAGHTTQLLSRHPERLAGRLRPGLTTLGWSPPRPDPTWVESVATADAVVNLAGDSLAQGRWTERKKATLRASRLETTAALVEAMAGGATGRPRVLVNASAVGYYGDRGEDELTEASSAGSGLLAKLCVDWEAAARRAETLGVRLVIARFGVVLGTGGALPRLVLPFRFFVGGPLGSGAQWMSWVHHADAVGFIRFALEHDALVGPFNVTFPQPIRNRDLVRLIGAVLQRPSVLRVPSVALRVALGDMADEMLLVSQRVLPAAMLTAGYPMRFPRIEDALREALFSR
jgi:uncharacterized protein (TIGR01777 family)